MVILTKLRQFLETTKRVKIVDVGIRKLIMVEGSLYYRRRERASLALERHNRF